MWIGGLQLPNSFSNLAKSALTLTSRVVSAFALRPSITESILVVTDDSRLSMAFSNSLLYLGVVLSLTVLSSMGCLSAIGRTVLALVVEVVGVLAMVRFLLLASWSRSCNISTIFLRWLGSSFEFCYMADIWQTAEVLPTLTNAALNPFFAFLLFL